MNRSTAREFVAPGTSVATGEVLVADRDRGPGARPAAGPGRAAGGRDAAAQGDAGPLRRRWRTAPTRADDGGGATVFVATCAQRDGSTAAIAAAASAADRVAVAAAQVGRGRVVGRPGTRRLLAGRAARGAAARPRRWPRRGAPSRPPHRARLRPAGRRPGGDLRAGRAGRGVRHLAGRGSGRGHAVIFPAHGVPAAVQAEAAARELEVIDATCPLVAGVHAEARTFAGARRRPRADRPAPPRGRGRHRPARRRRDHGGLHRRPSTATLRVPDPKRVSYLLQPGIPVEDAAPVDRRAAVAVPGAARPAPRRVLLRRVRPGGDHTRGRVSVRRDARPRLRRRAGHPPHLRAGPRLRRQDARRGRGRRHRPVRDQRDFRDRDRGIDLGRARIWPAR